MGLSLGLIYVPSTYAKTPELIELAKVAGEMVPHEVVEQAIEEFDGEIAGAILSDGDIMLFSV